MAVVFLSVMNKGSLAYFGTDSYHGTILRKNVLIFYFSFLGVLLLYHLFLFQHF